jgi:helicase
MEISHLKEYVPLEFIEKFKKEGIKKLYPHQVEAIKKGIFERRNLIIATPTASGKTFLATLGIIKNLNLHKKILYIVPLVALASEKYQYYKNFFKSKMKVALSIGDLDSSDPWLRNYQLIITTSEKLDSLIRHGIDWIDEVGLVIIDEIHLINDAGRGPTLEILITLLKKNLTSAQFLGLSATITNVEELAGWLNAGVIKSDFRPIKLYEGVCYDKRIRFINKNPIFLKDLAGEEALVKDTVVKRKKQLLIFVSSRPASEALSERLAMMMEDFLKKEERSQLKLLSQQILGVLSPPTKQCQRLAKVIKNGVSFHHAGLLAEQKNLIEDNFRRGLIKIICCTPTLALGVNFPAFRVLVRDVKRYYPGLGSLEIPVLEYKQFAGRAGRPQYDKFGEAIILAKSEEDAENLIQKYILGKPESIESKLAQHKALRIHSLSLIASGIVSSLEGLLNFFILSFFGFQYKDVSFIEDKLKKIIDELENWKFIEKNKDRLYATFLGKRISCLYIDPQSAHFFIEALKLTQDLGFSELGILQILSYVEEMQPGLKLKPKDFALLQDIVNQCKEKILMDVPLAWDDNYEDFLRSIKTALCFLDWIEERSEAELLEKFQITPGELHNKLEIADWLIYSLIEIAKILNLKGVIAYLKKLRIRLNYGIKEELLDLVSLSQIGRVRARRLYEKGIKNISYLKKVPFATLSEILGRNVALKITEQLK